MRRLADSINGSVCGSKYASAMAASDIETSSRDAKAEFPGVWYGLASDDHVWVHARFNFLLREARRLGLDPEIPRLGLDIGCGHGAVQRQLASRTAWFADGCDLNRDALALNSGHRGRVLFYDILQRDPKLEAHFDFLVLFDVIEHVADAPRFLAAAAHHLKPGGYAFVNVPALPSLFSKYDVVQGHVRRYDKHSLKEHLLAGGFELCSMRYWGLSMLPLAYARKAYVRWRHDPSDIMTAGFQPPGRIATRLMAAALAAEARWLGAAPAGTSLLAIARKPALRAGS